MTAAEHGPDASKQRVRIKRLVEIVVGSLFQGISPLSRRSYLCEQDDGRPVPGLPYPAQDPSPIQVRHQDIQNDQIGLGDRQHAEGLFAIRGYLDLKARPIEKGRQV